MPLVGTRKELRMPLERKRETGRQRAERGRRVLMKAFALASSSTQKLAKQVCRYKQLIKIISTNLERAAKVFARRRKFLRQLKISGAIFKTRCAFGSTLLI